MSRGERPVLMIFGALQLMVAGLLFQRAPGISVAFVAIGVMALMSATRSPGPPRRAKSRARKR